MPSHGDTKGDTRGGDDTAVYRHFNNYIKKRLMRVAVDVVDHPSRRTTHCGCSTSPPAAAAISGKWTFLGVLLRGTGKASPDPPPLSHTLGAYVGVDISAECIEEARSRHEQQCKQPPQPAVAAHVEFCVDNCFLPSFWETRLALPAPSGDLRNR